VAGPLGGGLILVHDAYAAADPGPVLDVFTFDAGTGQQTLLGTVPSGGGSYGNTYNFQWSADRKHVLITQNGEGPVPLDSRTAAGRDLTFICCTPVREALPNGEGTQALHAYDWALSPRGDRIAGLHNGQMNPAWCDVCIDAIVIVDVDSGDLRTLPLPPGSHANGSRYPISWSPDESAVVIGGCRPCNDPVSPDVADITPTAVEHGHLFIVPVDGSPVRELLDATETGLYSAAWSPDGTTIAFGRYECAADEHAPYCQRGTHSLGTLSVANGEDTVLAEVVGDHFFWSPDGRRITFADQSVMVVDADGGHLTKVADGWEPTWSPDGKWLMFSTTSGAPSLTRLGPWIVPADGGEPRLLGPYAGWAW
jgi:Tol biopolymer transport system component